MHKYELLENKERDRQQSLIFDAQLLVNAAVVSLQNAFKDFLSRKTINNYIKLGMEVIRDTPSHNKIPLHTLDIWKNPVMASRVQFLFAKYQLRKQSNQEKYDDIVAELQGPPAGLRKETGWGLTTANAVV
jgi:hypothetical protein